MLNRTFILTIFLLTSCAQVTSLNLKKHQFGQIPTKVVWIQIDGLTTEHLSLLKFSGTQRQTAFEQSVCMGNAWSYNLYTVRPTAYSSFLSQLTGKENIKNNCSDYDQKPIWKYLGDKGFKMAIFEGKNKKSQSLLKATSCKKHSDYLDEVSFLSMNKAPGKSKQFHINSLPSFEKGNIYYDRSCSRGKCFTPISRNVQVTYEHFAKTAGKYLYIVQDFEFQKMIERGNVKAMRDQLFELNQIVRYFNKLATSRNDLLVLVTGANSTDIHFPKEGTAWNKFTRSKRVKVDSSSQLLSPVFASGARAENFCGIYNQSEIMPRIFSGSKQQGLEFSIINPFESE